MNTIKKTLGISLLLITFLFSGQVQGQKRSNNSNRNVKTERNYNNNRNSVGNNHYNNNRYRHQPIYRNTHYRYPYHHRVIRTLPVNHVTITYGGLPYFYYSGIYYTTYNNQYVVVLPPRGFRIAVLPVGHVRVIVGPSIYYYHSGVYYVETSITTTNVEEGKYEVTQPPVGVVVSEISKDAEEVFIDGKIFYDYNDVLYKKVMDNQGNTTYEVVYSKTKED